MLSDDELRVLAHALAARHDEPPDQQTWLELAPELVPVAHRLAERGWLLRRCDDEAVRWRYSDLAAVATVLSNAVAAASPN